MKANKIKNPCKQAADNFTIQIRRWAGDEFTGLTTENNRLLRSAYNFNRLRPNCGCLEILEYIRRNPNCTRGQVKQYFWLTKGKSISSSTFQSLLWAKLITCRKYNLTRLGEKILEHYGI